MKDPLKELLQKHLPKFYPTALDNIDFDSLEEKKAAKASLKEVHNYEIGICVKRKAKIVSNFAKLSGVIISHYTPALLAELEGDADYEDKEKENDCI